jgi:hypothetical protein
MLHTALPPVRAAGFPAVAMQDRMPAGAAALDSTLYTRLVARFPVLMSFDQIRAEVNISRPTIYAHAARGALDIRALGGRSFVTGESFARFLASLAPAPIAKAPR